MDALEGRRLLATVPAGFIDAAFGTAFGGATSLAFAPDGRAFALSQGGTVRVIQPNGATTVAGSLTVDNFFERGLLGIAFDPDFTANNHLYLYYTKPGSPARNQISRFTMNGNSLNVASEQVIVTLDALSAGNHNGGALNFGPDGKLYVAVGENAVPNNAQSLANRHGKILRYDADGTIPADNPTSFAGIAGTPTGANRAIWATGLRNPYTFAFNPVGGAMHINDVGQSSFEEVNLGLPGRNYGWPATEGTFNQTTFPNFTKPIHHYARGDGAQRGEAIAGGAFYNSNAPTQFPAQYQGKYFFGDYTNNWIGYIDPAAPPASANAHVNFATGTSGITDLDLGPDGALYYLQYNTGVRRITVNPSLAPTIVEQPADQSATVGGSATFTVNAVGGQNAGALAYQWQRNGQNIPGATAATYVRSNLTLADGGATFRAIVTNAAGTAISNAATLTVSAANDAPVPTITAPATGLTYRAGQSYAFAGGATDAEDGTLPAGGLSWRIDFHHADHTHPFYPETGGISGGSFTIPTTGEVAADVFYRVYLTATDSGGRMATTFTDVLPETSTFTLATAGLPAGFAAPALFLDGQPIAAGTATLGVVGVTRTLTAAVNLFNARQYYDFVEWSDGGARSHDVATPEDDATYTAVYRDVTRPLVVGNGTFSRERLDAGRPPHEVTFAFSEPVAAPAAALTLQNLTTGQAIPSAAIAVTADAATRELRFSYVGNASGVLPDGNYRATLASPNVTDAAGNTVAGNFPVVTFRVLAGDANDDGTVGFIDLVVLAKHYGTGGRAFAQGNFDYSTDGAVGFGDLVILAQNYNVTLPAATSAGRDSGGKPRKPVSADVL